MSVIKSLVGAGEETCGFENGLKWIFSEKSHSNKRLLFGEKDF